VKSFTNLYCMEVDAQVSAENNQLLKQMGIDDT
jgi:hypothetical protein